MLPREARWLSATGALGADTVRGWRDGNLPGGAIQCQGERRGPRRPACADRQHAVAGAGARCAVGAGYRPRLPAGPAGVLGGRLRLARAGTLAERVRSLPGRDRWCPGAFCARTGPRRPRNPADLDKWLAELLRRVPAARALADGPGRAWH